MTAAVRKVGNYLATLIGGFTTAAVYYDRNEDEPLGEEEGDTIVIRLLGSNISPGIELSGSEYRATYQFDFMARTKDGETRDAACERMAGEVLAAIESDRALGGRVAMIEEQGYTPATVTAMDSADAQMEALIVFFTPRGDFNTIVGHGGMIF